MDILNKAGIDCTALFPSSQPDAGGASSSAAFRTLTEEQEAFRVRHLKLELALDDLIKHSRATDLVKAKKTPEAKRALNAQQQGLLQGIANVVESVLVETKQAAPPSPRETPSFKSFSSLPLELRDQVIFWTLATQPETRIPLLLTSKAVKQSTAYITERGVAEYIRNQHGCVAVMLFNPYPLRCDWEDHIRQVEHAIGRINGIVEHTRNQLKKFAEASEVAGVQWLDVDGLVTTMKMGLYLLELIQWSRPLQDHAYVRSVLAALPPHAVLILRTTSLLLALTCRKRICQAMEYHRQSMLGIDWDDYSVVRAIETMMLSRGCRDLAAIVIPTVPGPEPLPRTYQTTFPFSRAECDQAEAPRRDALAEFMDYINLVRNYAFFPPGRLRDGLKTEIVGRRIQEHYGAAVPLYSTRLEDVMKLQDLAESEVGKRSEMEVMRDFKMASGL